MTFDEWWLKLKPAECDEMKEVFRECWETSSIQLRNNLEWCARLLWQLDKYNFINPRTYEEEEEDRCCHLSSLVSDAIKDARALLSLENQKEASDD